MTKKQKPRDWQRYDFIRGGNIIHSGITTDAERREREHKDRFRGGKLRKVGPKVTEDAARAWEKTKRKSITPQKK